MEIILAKSAGFCFGVDLAVKKVQSLIKDKNEKGSHKSIFTYGPIIHNPYVVKKLNGEGVHVINDLDALDYLDKGTILIRSHGVTEDEFNIIKDSGFEPVDSTCPYVKKIHRIVRKDSMDGCDIIIVGNKNHPEIKGIAGWVKSRVYFVESLEDVNKLNLEVTTKYSIVAQTTFNYQLYEEILNKLQKKSIHVIINETICTATMERQIEANELSKKVTKMIVIGGRNSSNTRKLYEICKSQCKDTYYIETIEDLVLNVFAVNDIIGITAGASTPKNIIEEVISNVRNVEFWRNARGFSSPNS